MEDLKTKSLTLHKKYQGKLSVNSKVPMETAEDLSVYYSPGVAEPCKEIAKDKEKVYEYTMKGNLVAVVTDGTAVLGLGDIGPEAALPVMEGKCALFKSFGDIDAIPICLNTKDVDEIVNIVKAMSPGLGGINLEDISAPRCFEIEKRLCDELDIPVFHDDQYGTAIVTLAGLINALSVVDKKANEVKVVISGAGAAGVAICKLLLGYGFENILMTDSRGIICKGRENLNWIKEELAEVTNKKVTCGDLAKAMEDADIFIGVSMANILTKQMVESMADDPIIFAMANPDPEIKPDLAKEAGAAVIATGRSDYPNQVNNVLVFPGIFKGALEARANDFTFEMKIAAAEALAELVDEVDAENVIPDPFDKRVAEVVAAAVKRFV